MQGSLRLFVGFGLSEHDRAIVERVQQALRGALLARGGRVRWVSPGDFHLTLRFIGGVPRSAVHQHVRALERALSRAAPVSVYVDQLLGFPGTSRARTLTLGLREPEGRLRAMARLLEQELAALGVAPEPRPLVPHVTLARASPALDLGAIGGECAHHDTEIMLSQLCLFESRSAREAVRYVPLSELRLVGDAHDDSA
jgi:RNA 2',3'-cyclic 3'-phosphodiesterase